MKVPVRAVLFSSVTETNLKSLKGEYRGQFDVRLGTDPAFSEFVDNVSAAEPTPRGGWTKHLTIEPLGGPAPVPQRTLRMRFMGAGGGSHLRRDHYFASQQPGRTYDLWAAGRAFPGDSAYPDVRGDVIMLIRDVRDRFHARWVRRDDVATLPVGLRGAIASHRLGVWSPAVATEPASPAAQRVVDALRVHYNVLLYGPPATGKTHLVREVIAAFDSPSVVVDTEDERTPLSAAGQDVHTAWTTFHQSYSYEDFLIGLRPEPAGSGGFTLEPVPGVLLELAEWARGGGRSSLLVIDEINRGNVSRIFGEFITLMEPDKRLDDGGHETATTVGVRLPFVRQGTPVEVALRDGSTPALPVPFAMPRRVYTLATMNSVDKSVAPLDAALRRRFHVIDVSPDLDEIAAVLGVKETVLPSELTTTGDVRTLAVTLLRRLNHRVSMFLGPDFAFGHWYLRPLVDRMELAETLDALAEIWRAALFPQLEEHFLGRSDQLLGVLGPAATGATALVVETPPIELEELGASTTIGVRRGATVSEIIELVRLVASG